MRHFRANSLKVAQADSRVKDHSHTRIPVHRTQTTLTPACAVMARKIRATDRSKRPGTDTAPSLPQRQGQPRRRTRFVAMDRATRWRCQNGGQRAARSARSETSLSDPHSDAARPTAGVDGSALRSLHKRAATGAQGHMSSTGLASTADLPHRNLPGPTARQRARVAVSGRSCKAIGSHPGAAFGTTHHRRHFP